MKNYTQTVQELSQRIAQNPSDWDAYYQRALLKYDFQFNRYEFAEDVFVDFDTFEHSESDEQECQKLDTAHLIADLDTAIDLNDACAEAYALRAYLYAYTEAWVEGERDFTKALVLDPHSVMALMVKAEWFIENDSYNEMIDTYTQIIAIDPNYVPAYQERAANYCFLKGDTSNLEMSDYAKLIELQPTNFYHYLHLAQLLLELDNFTEAIKVFDRAIQLDEKLELGIWGYMNRGEAYSNLGESQKAIKDYNKAIEIAKKEENDQKASAYSGRGNYYFDHCEYQLAMDDFTRATEFDPEYSMYRYYRAQCYEQMGELDLAIQEFEKSIALMDFHNDTLFKATTQDAMDKLIKQKSKSEGFMGKLKKWFN